MNKVGVRIWDREFELDVSYQNYSGEDITENQLNTLKIVPTVDYDVARAGVEKYIRNVFSFELEYDNLDKIFRFVMPKSVLIPRTETSGKFAIMCNCKFDMEHGVAIIFENGKYEATGPQDLIL